MSKLFETGRVEFPTLEDRIRALLWGRENLEHSEDNWNTDDMCKVRQQLPPEFWGMDIILLKNRLMQDRRDKRVAKPKEKQLVDRLQKLLRDFEKSRERRGTEHLSPQYIAYVVEQSDEWRAKAREHKERCKWHCQLCGTYNVKLEVHHTAEGYRNLGNERPWHLLAVCDHPCHPVADMLRAGWLLKRGLDEQGFFSEEDIPD